MSNEARVYAVSYGNGNDGVSQMFPDFYCRTGDPWNLARLAIVTNMNKQWQPWAAECVDVDGEAKYTIYATLLDPPNVDDPSDADDGDGSWSERNGAWMIAEVFPVDADDMPDMSDPWHKPVYDSLEDCFGADVATYADKTP